MKVGKERIQYIYNIIYMGGTNLYIYISYKSPLFCYFLRGVGSKVLFLLLHKGHHKVFFNDATNRTALKTGEIKPKKLSLSLTPFNELTHLAIYTCLRVV